MNTYAKDFTSNYQAAELDDWQWDDFSDLSNALRTSIRELFSNGSDPMQALETDVIPGLLAALRAYVQEGVNLGYTGASNSDYGMMSLAAGLEGKAGYLNAQSHVKISAALDGVLKHAKAAKSELANLGSPAARQNRIAGTPLYSASAPLDFFEQKEDEEDTKVLLSTLATSLRVSNELREGREQLESSMDPLDVLLARRRE